METKQRLKVSATSRRGRGPLNSRKASGSRSFSKFINDIRIKLKPFSIKMNYHYRLWGNKLDTIIFVLILTSIPLGQFNKFLTPIIIYYIYLTLLVCFRIFMQWDFFYNACRMIALYIEMKLTKHEGFHKRFNKTK